MKPDRLSDRDATANLDAAAVTLEQIRCDESLAPRQFHAGEPIVKPRIPGGLHE
jgi:hypothetical protein